MDEEINPESQGDIDETVQVAKNVGDKTTNVAKKAGKVAKKAGKAVGKVAKSTGKAFAKLLSNPIFWKIMLIVGIILLVVIGISILVSAVVYALTMSDYDSEKGTLSSLFGIEGDSFYGARFVYEDDEAAALEIQDDYLKLTYNLLNDVKTEAGITITLSANYISDEKIIDITTDYANVLVGSPQIRLSIAECGLLIEHFGFEEDEITIVFDSIANSLTANSWSNKSKEEIIKALSDQYKKDTYLSYKNVTPKIYLWDYIFESEDDTLKNLPRKNYYGFIFMPKEEVKITHASFVFVVDSGYGVDVCLKHKTQDMSDSTPLGDVITAHSGWYADKHMEESYECDFDITLNTFEAFEQNNINSLSTHKSVYAMLGDNSFENYFEYTDEITGFTLIENIKTTNYIYLEMSNKDEDSSPFNFAEQILEYE